MKELTSYEKDLIMIGMISIEFKRFGSDTEYEERT